MFARSAVLLTCLCSVLTAWQFAEHVVRASALQSSPNPPAPVTSPLLVPAKSAFTAPAPNACQSRYDQFYGSEPGVYAYWPMCESGGKINVYDYVGKWDLSSTYVGGGSPAFGSGTVTGGRPGPVPDGETAAQVTSASNDLENQNIPVNKNEGTLATWINADSTDYPVTAVFLGGIHGKSLISIGVANSGSTCFNGTYVDFEGVTTVVKKCGYTVNTWRRLVLTWSSGTLSLYLDGVSVANGTYAEKIDDKLFYYRLFPGCCDTRKQMTLAKALVANQAWSSSQVAQDFAPGLITPPTGGVYVTNTRLGTIHRDVLGYADYNANLSSSKLIAALKEGLRTAGVTSVRYANGAGGITADLENWQGGPACTHTPRSTTPPQNSTTGNKLDAYLSQIAEPLHLHVGFTVNYGTNPPDCDAGGDPTINGANLVRYANQSKNYQIRYWEIGNEQYSPSTEADFHPQANTGGSYARYEPAFYDAMKKVDPSILIAVPISGATYGTQTDFDFPVLAGAKYDAIVYHSYPMTDPISDGNTLYQDRVSSNLYRIRGALLTLQTELLSHSQKPDAIWITEWDGNVSGNKWSKQSMGAVMPLFAVTQLAEYMQAGVQYATWWAQGETNVCSRFNYDPIAEKAYSWWECGSGFLTYTGPLPEAGELPVGLKPGDLTPAARAFQLLSESGFVTEGEHMLRTVADGKAAPWLVAYAATHGSSYSLILINRDRDNAHTVPVSIAGTKSCPATEQWTYGRDQYDRTSRGYWSADPVHSISDPRSGSCVLTIPRWSANVILLAH
jgi:hypothetical protein